MHNNFFPFCLISLVSLFFIVQVWLLWWETNITCNDVEYFVNFLAPQKFFLANILQVLHKDSFLLIDLKLNLFSFYPDITLVQFGLMQIYSLWHSPIFLIPINFFLEEECMSHHLVSLCCSTYSSLPHSIL